MPDLQGDDEHYEQRMVKATDRSNPPLVPQQDPPKQQSIEFTSKACLQMRGTAVLLGFGQDTLSVNEVPNIALEKL